MIRSFFWIEVSLAHKFALPAFSEVTNEWLSRPMSTGEANLYLKEMLAGLGFDRDVVQQLGCHSLKKRTLLSWLSMGSYASIPDRRLAGHHIDANNVSPVPYSRDELTRVLAIEHRVIKDIRKKKFKPDQPRVQRLADLVAASGDLEEHPHIMVESDGDPEDLDEGDLVRQDIPGYPCTHFDDLTLDVAKRCRIHINAGVCVTFLLTRPNSSAAGSQQGTIAT